MVLFLAFSLQDQVEKYGAYVGIAAFFGLAVLSVLYFSQARELRRLRDWAGRAPERAQELEARVAANAQAARSVQAVPRAATPAAAAAAASAASAVATPQVAAAGPATQVAGPEEGEAATGGNGAQADAPATPEGEAEAASPDGAKPAGVDHEPEAAAEGDADADSKSAAEGDADAQSKPVAVGAADAEPKPAATGDEEGASAEGEPEESKAAAEGDAEGAPAEGPKPDESEPAAEGDAAAEPKPAGGEPAPAAASVQAGNGAPPDADDAEESEAPPVPVPGQAGNGPMQPPRPDVPPVPRATPVPRRTPAPAPAAALRQPSRSATLPPRRPTVPPPRSEERGHGWILPAALGVVVLAAAVFGATQLIGGDDAPAPRTPASDQAAETPDGGGSAPEPTQAALTRESAKLAVLNGTTVEGLASNQADTLKTAGYTGAITTGNNTEQRVQSTVLYGDGARSLARDVARRLTIASVAPLDADTRALGEDADIVVILGQDKAP